MIDIDSYRQRIGLFRSEHRSYCGAGISSRANTRNIGVFAFCITFIIYAGLTESFLVNDPSIESKPGPSQTISQDFVSSHERLAYRKLKDVYKDISQVSCHRMFLCACDTLNVIPRGFEKQKLSLASCKPNDALVTALKSIEAASAREKMRLHIDHYESIANHLTDEKNKLSRALSDICSTNDRYAQLIADLEANMVRNRDSRMLRHNQKLNTLLDSQLSTSEWLPDLQLTSIEKSFITNNEYLCDRIIDAAMQLLIRDNPQLFMQSVILPHSLLIYSPTPTIHVHHVGGNHFVTSSTVDNPGLVTVYDSLNSNKFSTELNQQITSIYSPDTFAPTIRQAHIVNPQKGGIDCGIFSIAYAIELIAGNDPMNYEFDQGSMRQHLISCLEKRKLEPFPKKCVLPAATQYHHINSSIPSTDQWTPEKRTFRASHSPNNCSVATPVHNRFSPLSCTSFSQTASDTIMTSFSNQDAN